MIREGAGKGHTATFFFFNVLFWNLYTHRHIHVYIKSWFSHIFPLCFDHQVMWPGGFLTHLSWGARNVTALMGHLISLYQLIG